MTRAYSSTVAETTLGTNCRIARPWTVVVAVLRRVRLHLPGMLDEVDDAGHADRQRDAGERPRECENAHPLAPHGAHDAEHEQRREHQQHGDADGGGDVGDLDAVLVPQDGGEDPDLVRVHEHAGLVVGEAADALLEEGANRDVVVVRVAARLLVQSFGNFIVAVTPKA
jgi:hypothetical protein